MPLQALSGEPQIMFARSNGPRFFDAVLAACREAGFSMNIAHEVDNLYTACALVAAGLGVCLVPAGVQDSHSASMVLRPVTPALPHIDMHIALAYKPQSKSELVPLFVDVVQGRRGETGQPEADATGLVGLKHEGRVQSQPPSCLLRLLCLPAFLPSPP